MLVVASPFISLRLRCRKCIAFISPSKLELRPTTERKPTPQNDLPGGIRGDRNSESFSGPCGNRSPIQQVRLARLETVREGPRVWNLTTTSSSNGAESNGVPESRCVQVNRLNPPRPLRTSSTLNILSRRPASAGGPEGGPAAGKRKRRAGSGKRASNRGEEEERAGDAEPGSGERFRDTVFRKGECSLKV